MTTGQTIETKIVVDAKQATAEVDKFNGKLSSISELANKPIASLKDLQDGAQKLQQKLAPTAAAISGVSSALGQAGGEAGKVVAGFGQMAAAFGAGGPWAVAIVGATMLVDEYIVAQKEMEKNAEIADRALNAFGDNLKNRSGKGLEWIKEKADEAAKAVRDFGKTSAEVTVATARLEVAATEARIKGIDDTIDRRNEHIARLKAEMSDPAVINSRRDIIDRLESLRDENVLLTKAKQTREELTATLKAQQDETRRLITQQAALSDLENLPDGSADLAKKKGGGRVSAAKVSAAEEIDSTTAMLLYVNQLKQKATDEYLAAKKTSYEQEQRDLEAAEREKTRIAAEAEKKRKEDAERLAKEKADAVKAIEKQQADFVGGIQQAAASQLLSTGQAYIDAKIKGEKDAEQKAVASFLSATGQQLVASGTRAIFEGFIANAALPGSGMPLIGMGTAAIAAGLTMGGVGTAMTPPPAETKGAGSSSAARDRGAAPRSSRGGGDGGPLVINVSYGVGGPLPEDTAREIARVMRTGNRRRGAA